ncbi:MAG: small-conductance mechanosensitive channel [Roseivirga sp.]|jgi:small-conductance mechanosensitive channel
MAKPYDWLINYINTNIPFLGEPIKVFGEGFTFTTTEIIIPIVFLFIINLFGNLVRSILINKILSRYVEDRKTVLSIGNTTKYIILAIGVATVLAAIGFSSNSDLNYALTYDSDDKPALRIFDVIRLVFLMTLLVFLSGKLKTIFVKQILSKYSDDIGVSQSIGTIIQYFFIIMGAFVVIQSSGINLGSLNVLAGALGVGIGFGLQNIANNFISGLIILFERPIKVGDRIEVGNVTGDVVKISSRASTVSTNDNISIIIPNSELINKQVINWSHNDRRIRYHVPVGVSYKEDPEFIRKVILEVADENKDVLKRPAPEVLFIGYGDSSIDFDLLVWTSSYIDKPIILRSQLYYEIFKMFKEHKIEIPFPQRDLHLKSGWPNTDKA